MKRNISSRHKGRLIGVIFSLPLLVLAAIVIVMDPLGLFTIVPPDFSRTSWQKIQLGMKKEEVLLLLPEPIERCIASDAASCFEYWRYSQKTSWNILYMDYKVFFDKKGEVIGKKNRIDCD